MNNYTHIFSVCCIALILSSCGVNRFIAPPYTDVGKILTLRSGMTVENVSETLRIKPYDIIHSYENGRYILIFNYRLKDRDMIVPQRSASFAIYNENSQREGETRYNAIPRELFLLFKQDTLAGIYGERFFPEGVPLEHAHRYFAEGESFSFKGTDLGVDSDQEDYDGDLAFLQYAHNNRFRDSQKDKLVKDELVDQRRNFFKKLAYGGGVVVVLLLALF